MALIESKNQAVLTAREIANRREGEARMALDDASRTRRSTRLAANLARNKVNDLRAKRNTCSSRPLEAIDLLEQSAEDRFVAAAAAYVVDLTKLPTEPGLPPNGLAELANLCGKSVADLLRLTVQRVAENPSQPVITTETTDDLAAQIEAAQTAATEAETAARDAEAAVAAAARRLTQIERGHI